MFKSSCIKMSFVSLGFSGALLVTVVASQSREQKMLLEPANEGTQQVQSQSSTMAAGGMQMSADSVLSNWPAKAQEVAKKMIDKYGQPAEVTASMLVWHNTGPWKRTIIYRDEVMHQFPMSHPDLLEQFIDYRVPVGKFSDLAAYDGSVIVERTKGEISARCDKEEANFLALNLAHDIVTGKRTVEEARRFYAETIKALMAGQKPAYTQKLQFEMPKGNTADPDKPAMAAP